MKKIKMLFSDVFNVSPELIKSYGAVDISLVCDIPLFVDPLLIFNSIKPEYKRLHDQIIRYFHFLATKSQTKLTEGEIITWFSFNEVKQNWLGYSLEGNGGLALGVGFSKFLALNIQFALNNNSISKSSHLEKAMLLYEGSGKDKISDLTVNLIKSFLLEYTEEFANKNIEPKYLKRIPVDKAYFSYDTESFCSKEYTLPCIINSKEKLEYVLLTPFDILREDEPSINRQNFYKSHERIRGAIDNEILRSQIENYIGLAVARYEEKQKQNKKKINERTINRIELLAFKELANQNPELYDYYIKLRESDTIEIRSTCLKEFNDQFNKIIVNAKKIIESFLVNGYSRSENTNAMEETKSRLKFFKHIIEDCDVYKNFYVNGKCITFENDLQRLFKLVWYGTEYKADFETNNGRGPADAVVSKGRKNQCVVEFKLASNSQLAHVFEQVKIYMAANNTEGSLIAIFYFNQKDYDKAIRVIKKAGYEEYIGDSIFLIDCRNDNKPSASKT